MSSAGHDLPAATLPATRNVEHRRLLPRRKHVSAKRGPSITESMIPRKQSLKGNRIMARLFPSLLCSKCTIGLISSSCCPFSFPTSCPSQAPLLAVLHSFILILVPTSIHSFALHLIFWQDVVLSPCHCPLLTFSIRLLAKLLATDWRKIYLLWISRW